MKPKRSMVLAAACAVGLGTVTFFHAVSAQEAQQEQIQGQAEAQQEITDCAAPISKSQVQYKLVVNCDRTISIEASEVELDLGGHTISGPGCGQNEPTQSGIKLNGQSHVRVINGTVKDFFIGVEIDSGDHNEFIKLRLVDNCTGIALFGSSKNQLSFNDISRNDTQGVDVRGSGGKGADNNEITFNVIAENSAIEFHESFGNGGVTIGKNADGNLIAFNTISRNLQSGVILAEAEAPNAKKNIVASNIVTQNGGSGHGRAGIAITAGNTENFFLRNTALDNMPVDLEEQNKDCPNTWKDNFFKTSSDGTTCIGPPLDPP